MGVLVTLADTTAGLRIELQDDTFLAIEPETQRWEDDDGTGRADTGSSGEEGR